MKKFFSEFFRRGLIACGFGPVVLAIVYMILHQTENVQMLTAIAIHSRKDSMSWKIFYLLISYALTNLPSQMNTAFCDLMRYLTVVLMLYFNVAIVIMFQDVAFHR